VKTNTVASKLKAAGIKGPISHRKGTWELENEAIPVAGAPKAAHKKPKRGSPTPLALSEKVHIEMARDKAGGMTDKDLAVKYAVSVTYVGDAMRTLFIQSKVGREILKGVLLDNAIAGGMKVRQSIDELTPSQAIVATSVMTQRFIDVDKHNSAMQTSDIDFTELNEIGDMLRELNMIAGTGPVIDVESTTEREE
jgi:hypothetical protein